MCLNTLTLLSFPSRLLLEWVVCEHPFPCLALDLLAPLWFMFMLSSLGHAFPGVFCAKLEYLLMLWSLSVTPGHYWFV